MKFGTCLLISSQNKDIFQPEGITWFKISNTFISNPSKSYVLFMSTFDGTSESIKHFFVFIPLLFWKQQ